MNSIQHRAVLDDTIEGVALCTPDKHVYFIPDTSDERTELFDRDMPRLMLHGRLDLLEVAHG